MLKDYSGKVLRFVRSFGWVRTGASLLLLFVSIFCFVLLWRRASDYVYMYLLFHYRESLGVMIAVVVGGYILSTTRALWYPKVMMWVAKFQTQVIPAVLRFSHEKIQKMKDWVIRFRQVEPKEKWSMVRRPIYFIVACYLVILVGPYFFPPRVATSFPANASIEAPLSGAIEIIFSRPVIRSTVERGVAISPAVDAQFSWEGNQKFTITPKKALERGKNYRVTLPGTILSTFGIPQFVPVSISFETVGNPVVAVASPEDEAPEDGTPITVVFDRPMIPLTTATNSALKKSAFQITPEIPGEGRWLGTTAYQFRPSSRFKKASTYTITVPKGLPSADGGSLQSDYTWSFTSVRPRVVARSLERGYQYASPTASVSATFNQPILPASASESFAVYDANNNRVPGKVVVSGAMVGFYATGGLSREETYTVKVAPGLRGVEGDNGMEVEDSWNFSVSPKPSVLRTDPQNNAGEVGELYRISVNFRSPMKQSSFENAISIFPKPEIKPSYYVSSYNGENVLSISTSLARSTRYSVTIGGNATDQYGAPLGSPYTFYFDTAPYKPAISMYPQGTYFGAFNQKITPRIVASVVNANSVAYTLYKLSRNDFLDLYQKRYTPKCDSDEACRTWQSYDTSKLEKVRTWSETYEAEKNTPVHVVTKVTMQNGSPIASGMYLLDMRIPSGAHDNMVMIVSDSTLTVKKSANQIFSWSVNQTTNDVLPGMNIQVTDVWGNTLAQGNSNADGVFMKDVNLKGQEQLLVWGVKGADTVVASDAWGEGINAYDFGLPNYYNPNESKEYPTDQEYKLYVTVDRPIYRPGQKVYFKGVIRKDSDGAYEQIPPSEMVVVEVTDATNKEIYTKNLPMTSFGSFSSDMTLGSKTELGFYTVKASYKGNEYRQQFQVEEYKKPELAVSVVPNKPSYIQGDVATIGISASYYFGAPVADAPVEWTLKTEDSSFRWDKDWRYEFGDPDSYWNRSWWYYTGENFSSGEEIGEGKGKTNSKGELTITPPIGIGAYATSQSMVVEAVVNDISNQSIAGSERFSVHKAGVFAGIHPLSYANTSGKEAKVEIVTVDTKGNELSSIPVALEFYKRTWLSVREKNPDDGVFYYTSKASDALVSTSSVTTDTLGRAVGSFVPSEGGTYKVIAKVRDASGNTYTSGSFVWVSGYGFQAPRENNDRIVVVSDKQDYLVGETMSIFVASPFASASAKTLLTAERGNILAYKVVDTNDTSNNFQLPIPPSYSPNIFIGAVVIKGSDQVKNPPEFKVGYTQVKVTDKKQQLDIKISTDKQKYKPGDTMKATIQTNDLLGHPVSTELAVGLVDKAVWDLSSVELPDIYKTFYQPRNLEVATSQLLTISIDRINANTNLGSKGGSGGGCFLGGTEVLMAGGVSKPIEDVVIGDRILTRKSDNATELVEASVLSTSKHTVPSYLIVNGMLRVTGEHRLFVNGGWKMAAFLEKGDVLYDADNHPVSVYSIERMRGSYDVYNFEVETYHTYFAGGVYVHNQKGGFDSSRSNFPDTAFWNPEIKTNQQGAAVVSIPLPDSLTTWRLGVIASSKESAFGSSTKEVVVGRDVLVRPFVPRFVSVGDKPTLGGIVVNTSGKDQSFDVRLESEGVRVLEANTKRVQIADGQQARVTWKTEVDAVPNATLTLRVMDENKNEKDAVRIPLPVLSYSIPETVAVSGQANGGNAKETITLPKEIDSTQGSATIDITPSLGGVGLSGLSYMLSYPYDCVEQSVSRFTSALSVHTVLSRGGLDALGVFSKKQLSDVVTSGVSRLVSTQHADGGGGWWIDQPSDPLFSAYALLGLLRAKKTFTVPAQTIDRATAYVFDLIQRGETSVNQDTQAYLLWVLSESGKNVSSYASVLFARRFELSIEARANLAVALYKSGNASESRRLKNELVSLAKNTATTTHWEESGRGYRYFGSNISTTSRVLSAISIMDGRSPLVEQSIRYLLTSRTDGHWATTWDTASAIASISDVMLSKKEEKAEYSYTVKVGNATVVRQNITPKDLLSIQSIVLPITQFTIGGSTDVQFAKNGTGSMNYSMNLNYFLPFTEITPLERGFAVIRELIDAKGNVLPSGYLAENSEVWERLIIVVPEERRFVAIEDPLPAGLESVNESLKNVSTLSKNQPKLSDEAHEELYFTRKEYRDNKTVLFARYLPAGVYEMSYRVRSTVPGIYHRMPASAYQLYVPDVSGHSDGGWFEVK